jgi:cytochrome c5
LTHVNARQPGASKVSVSQERDIDVRSNEVMRILSNVSTLRVVVSLVAFIACFMMGMTRTAAAQSTERSGKQVVDALCISCHGTGAGGAPKIGDRKARADRAAKGLSGLSSSALAGIRQMPAHGGNMTLTDVEVERAITYMVNQSGGKWTESVSRVAPTPPRSGKEIVETQCIKCHGTGAGGAPKLGDRGAWTQRVKQGFDTVVASAIRGHGAMPPRGGMADLTDPEIRSAIAYMLNSGTGATK